ncbi:DUF7504 family protein [Haloglomus litoreum]|uniref:DUF7504 family protein n=1 Tax=Haloglomus litoreum TaxID=3034026 RepID=UPI0023E8F200|nr:hypothetical protein [Haloglomus sp. DT116]
MSRDDSTQRHPPDPVASTLSGLGDASPVLVMAAAGAGSVDAVCRSLLAPTDGTEQALVLSLTDGVDGCLERLGDTAGLSTVHVITTRQGPSATTVTAGETTEIVTRRIDDPSDLPRLGIAASRTVTGADGEGRFRVCIDSLTAMLQYADRGRVYRFVQVLQDRLAQADTVAHYHMNPAAHDEQTVETLRQLFDAVVEVSADGSVELVE